MKKHKICGFLLGICVISFEKIDPRKQYFFNSFNEITVDLLHIIICRSLNGNIMCINEDAIREIKCKT